MGYIAEFNEEENERTFVVDFTHPDKLELEGKKEEEEETAPEKTAPVKKDKIS